VERGLPDGRKRFILYVLSAYLGNVKRLDEDEALQAVLEFLDNSCRNYGKCEKVYESFIRGDLQRVRSKGLRPTTLEKTKRERPGASLSYRARIVVTIRVAQRMLHYMKTT